MVVTASYIEQEINRRCNSISNVVSIITMGSCARGEETYFTNELGERELMSDYEMLVIVKSIERISELDIKLKQLREELVSHSHTVNFDLEWSYKTIRELARLDKRFIFFEAKSSGKVISGDSDVLGLFPDINIQNLNYSELNTIIIHRLYHVIRGMNSANEKFKKYLIARNSLDFASALLPLMGRLVSSYEKRMEELIMIGPQYSVPQELIDRHKDYLIMKKDYSSLHYERYHLETMLDNFYKDFLLLAELQRKLQRGKLFRSSGRQLLSALYRMNMRSLGNSLQWKNKMNHLYENLIEIIREKSVDEIALQNISAEMMELFGYC